MTRSLPRKTRAPSLGKTNGGSGGATSLTAGAGADALVAAACPGVTLMTAVEPGVGDVAGPRAAGAPGEMVTVAAGAAPPPVVNCAQALSAKAGVNDKMAIWRNVFMKD